MRGIIAKKVADDKQNLDSLERNKLVNFIAITPILGGESLESIRIILAHFTQIKSRKSSKNGSMDRQKNQ